MPATQGKIRRLLFQQGLDGIWSFIAFYRIEDESEAVDVPFDKAGARQADVLVIGLTAKGLTHVDLVRAVATSEGPVHYNGLRVAGNRREGTY